MVTAWVKDRNQVGKGVKEEDREANENLLRNKFRGGEGGKGGR